MNTWNPDLLTIDQLQTATSNEIAYAQYQFIVASVSLAFSIFFLYLLTKLVLWVVPKYWHKETDKS